MRFVVAFDVETGIGVETRGDGADDGEEKGRASADGGGGILSRVEEWEMDVGVIEETASENQNQFLRIRRVCATYSLKSSTAVSASTIPLLSNPGAFSSDSI